MQEFAARTQGNFSCRMYGFYLKEQKQEWAVHGMIKTSFLVWHRGYKYDSVTQACVPRNRKHQQRTQATLVVACRYWYELTDGFWGQFVFTQFPHVSLMVQLALVFSILSAVSLVELS